MPAAQGATLTSVDVTAPSYLAGAITTWTFAFTTATAIAAGGDIRIVFPAGFEVALTSTCTIVGKAATTTTPTLPNAIVCDLVANTLAASEAVSLTITDVKNPTTAQITGTFTIQTRDLTDVVVDSHTTNTEVITPNVLTAITISAPLQTTGTVETWTFTFTVFNAVNGNGDLRLVLPAGFQTSSGGATVCDVTAPLTITSETTTVVSATEVLCNLGALDAILAGTTVTLALTNVKNPTMAQTTGAFGLQTRDSADAVHDQDTTNTESIIASTLSAVSASAPLQTTGAVETWTLAFTTVNPVAASGDVRIVFPGGFQTSSGSATVCDIAGKAGESTTVASATEVTCNLGSATFAAGEAVSITFTNVKNPTTVQTTGAFTIQTRDASDAVHDAHTANTEAISGAVLTGVSVSAPSQTTGAVETWTVAFTTVNAVAESGDVRVVFPTGFQTSSGAVTVCDVAGKTGETTTVVSATQVTCNLGSATFAAGEAVSITFTNVKNPTTVQTTGAFTVQTRDAGDNVHDQHATNTESIVAASLTGVSASAPLQTTGTVETWTLAFTTVNPVAASGDIRIVFPTGFLTSSGEGTVCDVVGKTGETTSVVSATEVVCELGLLNALGAAEAVGLTLTNIRNPTTVQTTAAFTLQTRDASDGVHDQHASNTESITANALGAVSVSAPLQSTGAIETWTFAVTTFNRIAANGDIRIVFPTGYQTSSGAASVCDIAGKIGETTTVVSATEVVCNFNTVTAAGAEALTILVTNVKNPTTVQTTGAFMIQARDPGDAAQDQHASNTESIVANSLGSVGFSAPLQVANAVETWTVGFTTVNAVGLSGDVRVVFPSGFQTSSGAVTVCDVAGKTGETTTVASPTEVVCELGSGNAFVAAEIVSLTLTNLRNPATIQTTGTFTLQTRDSANAVHDHHLTNTESIAGANLASFSAGAPVQRAGSVETWTIAFATVNPVPVNGDIRILFPPGFQTSSGAATVCDLTGKLDESAVVVSATEVVCNLNTVSLTASEAVSLTLSSVKNPVTARTTGAFTVQTRDASDQVQDHHTSNTETIFVHDFNAGPTVTGSSTIPGATTTMTVAFTPYNVWELNGNLELAFPAGYTFHAAGSGSTVAAFSSGGSGTFAAPTQIGQTLTFARQGGTDIASGTAVVITISQVKNPGAGGLTGPFMVTTSDASAADHDLGTAPGILISGVAASPAPSPSASPTATPVPSPSPTPSLAPFASPSPSPNETVPPGGGGAAEPKAAGPPSPKVFTLPGFEALAAALALGLFAWSYRRRRRRR